MESRQQKILEILKIKKSVRILDLSKELKVSRETIRKDLVEMEDFGLLKKTYGGAVLDEANVETDYERRKTVNNNEKELIAEYALQYIESGDTIYLDYGTTTYCLAKKLSIFEELTVVTNSIPIINALIHLPNINLIILGGNVRKNEDSLFGSFGLNNAEQIFVDIGFFGCAGINPNAGLSNYHMGEIEISKKLINHSQTSIVLADDTKLGKAALYKTADLSDIDILITNAVKDPDLLDALSEQNTQIILTTKKEDDHND